MGLLEHGVVVVLVLYAHVQGARVAARRRAAVLSCHLEPVRAARLPVQPPRRQRTRPLVDGELVTDVTICGEGRGETVTDVTDFCGTGGGGIFFLSALPSVKRGREGDNIYSRFQEDYPTKEDY